MIGIKEIDQATQGFFTALPKHGVDQVSSEERKQQKLNFVFYKTLIENKLENLKDGDPQKAILRDNLNVCINNIDSIARHGGKFLGFESFAGTTEKEKAKNCYEAFCPILNNPTNLIEFTRCVGCVGATYKETKTDSDFKKYFPEALESIKNMQQTQMKR